jgi:hypothetical protein
MFRALHVPAFAFVATSFCVLACSGGTDENAPDENASGGTSNMSGSGASSNGGDMTSGETLSDIEAVGTKLCATFERCDIWLYRSYGTGQECVDFYTASQEEAVRLDPEQAALYSALRKGIESCGQLEQRECPETGHLAQVRWLAAAINECLPDASATPGDVCDDGGCGKGMICSGASATSCGACEEAPADWCSTSIDCAEDSVCDFSTNTCSQLRALGESCESANNCASGQCRYEKCAQPGAEGDACDAANACELSLRCTKGTCTRLGGQGDDCTEHEDCRYAFACAEGNCETIVSSNIPAGAACRFIGCEEGAYCDLSDNTCKKGELGDPCDYRCAGALVCVDNVCSGPQSEGAACGSDRECESGRCFADQCVAPADCP